MNSILANCSVSISELKRNPSALIDQADGENGRLPAWNHSKRETE